MTDTLGNWLGKMERLGRDYPNPLLWAGTPESLYKQIVDWVGASDWDPNDPRSRSHRIIGLLKELQVAGHLEEHFTFLDVCCGDAGVLCAVKGNLTGCLAYGVDIAKGKIAGHLAAELAGVELYAVPIQVLFRNGPPEPFDVVCMLNTYRGWESAQLPEREKALPMLADTWLEGNARFAVLTVNDDQHARFQTAGMIWREMGRGERKSKLVCVRMERYESRDRDSDA